MSEEDNYSVAQFQRTINPAFRSSSPQPSSLSHQDERQPDIAPKSNRVDGDHVSSRGKVLPPSAPNQHVAPLQPSINERSAGRLKQEALENISIPHNEYPVDGMTMFCRNDQIPSEQSSALSQARPSSRDSHSEYSNPTSFSSVEPSLGQHSPIRIEAGQSVSGASPVKQVAKKRSGFFSNSPFRRKSKHERETPVMITPTTRSTWGPSNTRNTASPIRSNLRETQSGSPEPVDPRASFQLNVGPNVFDVASPEASRHQQSPRKLASPTKELDPIAAALEELKGVNKQSSVRMSADRYAGVATPAPPNNGSMSHDDGPAAHRPTPPPSYASDQNIRRLDAPQPAFTASQMRQTTQKYVGKNHEMYGTGSRPIARGNGPDMPRATSPRPMQGNSPRSGHQTSRDPGLPRAASPNPYGKGSRPRQNPNTSPTKHSYSRHNSPDDVGRSPPRQSPYDRADRPGSQGGMEMQLADTPRNNSHQARNSGGRPVSQYCGGGQSMPEAQGGRQRSKSMAGGRQYTQDGRPILNFGKGVFPLFHSVCQISSSC